jgi:hypothetical protein
MDLEYNVAKRIKLSQDNNKPFVPLLQSKAKPKKQDASKKLINSALKNLSKLLAVASGSPCVSISIINGRMVVASNTFGKEMQNDSEASKGLDNVKKVLRYLEQKKNEIEGKKGKAQRKGVLLQYTPDSYRNWY